MVNTKLTNQISGVKPPPEASLYLPTDVTVNKDGNWMAGFEFCAKQHVVIHVITAWNPGDERPSVAVNELRNHELRQDISAFGFDAYEALGNDPNSEHSEKSWAVVGMSDEVAISLGKKYGQLAVFKITQSRQTVMGCFSEWKVSRGSHISFSWSEIADWILFEDHKPYQQQLLDRYFGNGENLAGFEGRQFEWFTKEPKDCFAANDFLALNALSVKVPATTARHLIEDLDGRYKKQILACRIDASKHVNEIDKSWLWRAGGPFNELFELLSENQRGIGRVVRSKLLACKFPDLIPIRDRRVERLLGWGDQKEWWEPMHALLDKTSERLNQFRINKSEISVTTLRKLDVILWMEARERDF